MAYIRKSYSRTMQEGITSLLSASLEEECYSIFEKCGFSEPTIHILTAYIKNERGKVAGWKRLIRRGKTVIASIDERIALWSTLDIESKKAIDNNLIREKTVRNYFKQLHRQTKENEIELWTDSGHNNQELRRVVQCFLDSNKDGKIVCICELPKCKCNRLNPNYVKGDNLES